MKNHCHQNLIFKLYVGLLFKILLGEAFESDISSLASSFCLSMMLVTKQLLGG